MQINYNRSYTCHSRNNQKLFVQGKNLQRGVRISDYRVVIGNGECKLSSLSDNQLTCRPPYNEPQLTRYDVFCNNISSVLVRNIQVYLLIVVL